MLGKQRTRCSLNYIASSRTDRLDKNGRGEEREGERRERGTVEGRG